MCFYAQTPQIMFVTSIMRQSPLLPIFRDLTSPPSVFDQAVAPERRYAFVFVKALPTNIRTCSLPPLILLSQFPRSAPFFWGGAFTRRGFSLRQCSCHASRRTSFESLLFALRHAFSPFSRSSPPRRCSVFVERNTVVPLTLHSKAPKLILLQSSPLFYFRPPEPYLSWFSEPNCGIAIFSFPHPGDSIPNFVQGHPVPPSSVPHPPRQPQLLQSTQLLPRYMLSRLAKLLIRPDSYLPFVPRRFLRV